MSQASQRHKFEFEMEGKLVALATLTFTLTGGLFPAGLKVVTVVNGDSTGNVEVVTDIADAGDAQAIATAVAASIAAETGFTASATGGVITIGIEAPNATVSTVSMVFLDL